MFDATKLVFYYAISPVHMGAGTAIGAIDSPIQREVHTRHPCFAGSGLKGALRHHMYNEWKADENTPHSLIERIFGPEKSASDFAGALALTDAQVVVLPVRALKEGFAYVTSPLALARLQRLAKQADIDMDWSVPSVQEGQAFLASKNLLTDGNLILESFEFQNGQSDPTVENIATWIAENTWSQQDDFFSQKIKTDLVVLNDTDFAHFARHAMVVEPHVKIDNDKGVAEGSGLFYVESLPPETLMVGLMQASVERKVRSEGAQTLTANEVVSAVLSGREGLPGINDRLLQIGGNASTGRGLVFVHAKTE